MAIICAKNIKAGIIALENELKYARDPIRRKVIAQNLEIYRREYFEAKKAEEQNAENL